MEIALKLGFAAEWSDSLVRILMIVANTLVSNLIEHRLRIVVGKGFVATEVVHESVGANSSANAREQCFHPSSVFSLPGFGWGGEGLSGERMLAGKLNRLIFLYLVGKCCWRQSTKNMSNAVLETFMLGGEFFLIGSL